MIFEFLKLSFHNLRRRKLRSWLTVFGIMISIATIFVLISVSLGLESAVKEQFRQLGTDKFFIQPKGQLSNVGTSGAVTLTINDVNEIKKVGGVKDISYWIIGSAKVTFSDQNRFVNVVGIPLNNFEVFKEAGFINTRSGRYLAAGDSKKIMIGSQYQDNKVFKRPIEVGNILEVNNTKFRVKAVLKPVGNPPDDKVIYMPLKDFEILFPAKKDQVTSIVVQVGEGEDVAQIAKRVEKRLVNSRKVTEENKDFTIQTPEEVLATFGTILNILTGFLIGIAAISLLVGGIGITNTMYTAVLERTKEIGVMKAVGAKNQDILGIFTVESGLIGLVGGAGGVIIGIIVAKAISFIATQSGIGYLDAATPWYLILGSLLFSFGIGAVAGLIPAYRASRIKPVIALRYE